MFGGPVRSKGKQLIVNSLQLRNQLPAGCSSRGTAFGHTARGKGARDGCERQQAAEEETTLHGKLLCDGHRPG
jgi:hypothetical protein